MKAFIYILFILSIILILSGYLIEGINSEKFIGAGTVMLFFIVIPLFLYRSEERRVGKEYRWKNKTFKDFILKNDNIKKENDL